LNRKEFLKAHWAVLAATDFFPAEVWKGRELVRYHMPFVIQLATHAVEIAGVVSEPTEFGILQIAPIPSTLRRDFLIPVVC
jgi:hypothetical protein